jgi:hypothetical protein
MFSHQNWYRYRSLESRFLRKGFWIPMYKKKNILSFMYFGLVHKYIMMCRLWWIYHTLAHNNNLKTRGTHNFLDNMWWWLLFRWVPHFYSHFFGVNFYFSSFFLSEISEGLHIDIWEEGKNLHKQYFIM